MKPDLRSSLHHYAGVLATAPEPLTAGQRLGLIIASVIVALTRFLALSKTLWDWDEALFATALHHFDVRMHQPHPPGFPLYIATAKIFMLFGLSDFHALQAVNLIAACSLFPVAIFLCRELRMSFPAALIGSLLLAFSPNVWFFGGTAFSDVPSLVLVMLACALLLRGCRSSGSYLMGAVILGVAGGYRPQNLLIGMAPALLSTAVQWKESKRRVMVAMLLGASIIAGSYGITVNLSGGWTEYRETLKAHQEYIARVDSFRNPDRPALWRVAVIFLVRSYREKILNISIALLILCGLTSFIIRHRLPLYLLIALFVPFAVLAILYLDYFSASRFSIGYEPLPTFLAGEGIVWLAALTRRQRAEKAVLAGVPAALLLWTTVWMWPAFKEVRRGPSPPVEAVEWIQKNVPRDAVLYVHGSMGPYASHSLAGYTRQEFRERVPVVAWSDRPSFLVEEGLSTDPNALMFTRPHRRLWDLVRQRYFEVFVGPPSSIVTFGAGWYDEEGSEDGVWRWMGFESVALLPPLRKARLSMVLYVPLDALPAPPTLDIFFNGRRLDTIHPKDADFRVAYDIEGFPDRTNELRIRTDRAVNPARQHLFADGRDLGVKLQSLSWTAKK